MSAETEGSFPGLRLSGSAKAEQVIDPLTLRLSDGRIIYLTGLDIPDWRPDNPGPIAVAARIVLEQDFAGQDVHLYQTRNSDTGRANRMGHILAHVERKKDRLWAQGLLLENGLARARTTPSNPEMARQMYALERAAREAKKGMWEKGDIAVLTPDTAAGRTGNFEIVEGQVHSAAIVKNRIFLNFGADWKKDFTASISPESRRAFARTGADPLTWNEKNLRVRGWMREYNGPFIEIDHPEQIEFPEDNSVLTTKPALNTSSSFGYTVITPPKEAEADKKEEDKKEEKKEEKKEAVKEEEKEKTEAAP